ncbi:ABC transporter substrate-binding protein [Streptomyces sp. NPDC005500]|uniref:ABC transporter substrate-binding protein n=1 Tax=Streptomyces sp. NPDC005500 TaxID=3155007 RepID=UPI0033B73F07
MPQSLPRRSLLSGASALIASSVLSGCGGDSDDDTKDRVSKQAAPQAGSSGLEKTSITVGAIPILDDAPLYLAIRDGYFKAVGLDVRAEAIPGGAAGIPRLGKDLDITFGNYVSFIQAHTKGLDLRVESDGFQATTDTFGLMVAPGGDMRSPADLKGRTVAVNIRSNILHLLMLSLLSAHNVNEKDVTFVEVPFPDMGTALKKGKVDAAVMVEPFITGAQKDFGAEQLGDVISGPTENLPIAGYACTARWAKENPNTALAFARAMVQAQHECSDRRTVTGILPSYTKIDRQTAAIVRVGAFPATLNPTRIQRVADLMHRFGWLKQKFDVTAMVA